MSHRKIGYSFVTPLSLDGNAQSIVDASTAAILGVLRREFIPVQIRIEHESRGWRGKVPTGIHGVIVTRLGFNEVPVSYDFLGLDPIPVFLLKMPGVSLSHITVEDISRDWIFRENAESEDLEAAGKYMLRFFEERLACVR